MIAFKFLGYFTRDNGLVPSGDGRNPGVRACPASNPKNNKAPVKWGRTPFPRFPAILNAGLVQPADLPIGRFKGWFFVRGYSGRELVISEFNFSHYVAHPVCVPLEGAWNRTLNTLTVRQDDADAQIGEIFSKCFQGWRHIRIARNQNDLLGAPFWR